LTGEEKEDGQQNEQGENLEEVIAAVGEPGVGPKGIYEEAAGAVDGRAS
jgi:hypothetical protein